MFMPLRLHEAQEPSLTWSHRVATAKPYTTQLQAGLGLVTETKLLLEIWESGMSAPQLFKSALDSGRFPAVTARRLRNIVVECFAPRYLVEGGAPAVQLRRLFSALDTAEFTQLLLLYTSRANPILGDFVRDVYWPRYSGGYPEISNENARAFVQRGIDDGKTAKRWSDTTVRRVSAYLTGCCADYGLLEKGLRSRRRIVPFHLSPKMAVYLAYELHFRSIADGALPGHVDWRLFGIGPNEVLDELKRLSLRGWFIVQAAGDLIRISWKQQTMEEFCDALAKS
jgi:hypothetical protein